MSSINAMKLLKDWDSGSKTTRVRILNLFLTNMKDTTGPDLEAYFSQAASLFLTRLTAWLRMTYMLGTYVKLQLEAISIYLTASSGQKYLIEFLEVGGVLTALEILGVKATKEHDKAQALRLLTIICNYGRKYKEILCESFGVRAVAECLAKSKSEETQECAKTVLMQLAEGNPRFQNQVYKALIALTSSTSPKAQQLAVQGLRIVQSIVEVASPNLVQPLINLLKSLHLEVQYEVAAFIRELMTYDLRNSILINLVKCLEVSKDDISKNKPEILQDTELLTFNAPVPIYVQQASVAKLIGTLSRESKDVSDELVQLGVVRNLLIAAGNRNHPDSQRQAGISVEYFIKTYTIVEQQVMEALGKPFFSEFMARPDTIYSNMTAIQADVLLSNKVDIVAI